MSHVRSLNRVILVGRVGRKPELTVIQASGRELAKFSMVTNEGYYDQSRNWKETEEWHNITAWGPLAQRMERNLGKGDMVLVEGKLKTRKWKDQNGQDRRTTDIEAQNIVILERRSSRDGSGQQSSYSPRTEKQDSSQDNEPYSNSYEDNFNEDFSKEEDPF